MSSVVRSVDRNILLEDLRTGDDAGYAVNLDESGDLLRTRHPALQRIEPDALAKRLQPTQRVQGRDVDHSTPSGV
jgi:hypothetical protein